MGCVLPLDDELLEDEELVPPLDEEELLEDELPEDEPLELEELLLDEELDPLLIEPAETVRVTRSSFAPVSRLTILKL